MKFLELLVLIFAIAKITGYIDWSWWLIFSPVIASAILALIIVFIESRI